KRCDHCNTSPTVLYAHFMIRSLAGNKLLRPAAHERSWPQAAVFDCDGLLADSEACWHRAYARLAAAHGRSFDDLDLRALAGASVAGAAASIARALHAPVDERRLRRLLHDSFTAFPPPAMAGARALVAR